MTKTERRLNRDDSDSRADEFRGPTAKEAWQHVCKWYCRNSRHVIVEAPGYSEYLHKEVVVVEAPRRNMKTVRIDIDGTRRRWPIVWLRPIITEEMQAAMQKGKLG